MGPVELASCSFGQSSKVSYLQMLTAVCAVVNGGELMQPYVVAKITAPDGTVVKEVQPTVKRRVISAEIFFLLNWQLAQIQMKQLAFVPNFRQLTIVLTLIKHCPASLWTRQRHFSLEKKQPKKLLG